MRLILPRPPRRRTSAPHPGAAPRRRCAERARTRHSPPAGGGEVWERDGTPPAPPKGRRSGARYAAQVLEGQAARGIPTALVAVCGVAPRPEEPRARGIEEDDEGV